MSFTTTALQSILAAAVSRGFKFQNILPGLPVDATYKIYGGDDKIKFFHPRINEQWSIAFDTLFFCHDFAKAFFGTRSLKCKNPMYAIPKWVYHIKELAAIPFNLRLSYLAKYGISCDYLEFAKMKGTYE